MSAEEYAAIMAEKWVIRRNQSWDGEAKMPHEQGSVINVAYPKPEGGTLTLMVGKVIAHNVYGRVFQHRFAQTGQYGGAGSQAHHLTGCPCPVDTLLVEYLTEAGIEYFYGYDLDSETLWKATVADIAAAPVMEYAKATVRRRHFLAEDQWAKLTGVREHRERQHVWLKQGERRVMFVPFLPSERTIVLHAAQGF